MKLLNIYALSAFLTRVKPTMVPIKKICKDCRHFIGDNIECRKFGDTNLITGKVTYMSARHVREDEKKCGEGAILFEENHFKIITIPYYFLKDHFLILLPSGLLGLYLFAIFYTFHK